MIAVNDPGSTRLVYAMVIGLVVVGVALVLLGVWLVRQTRYDPPVLAPLERMGDDSWRTSDPATQRRILDEVRPEGAEPLASGIAPPTLDAEFDSDDRPVPEFDDLRPGLSASDPVASEATADAAADPTSVDDTGDEESDAAESGDLESSDEGEPGEGEAGEGEAGDHESSDGGESDEGESSDAGESGDLQESDRVRESEDVEEPATAVPLPGAEESEGVEEPEGVQEPNDTVDR